MSYGDARQGPRKAHPPPERTGHRAGIEVLVARDDPLDLRLCRQVPVKNESGVILRR